MKVEFLAVTTSVLLCGLALPALSENRTVFEIETEDPFLWLEEVEGKQALDWVKAENKRSLDALTADPRFASMLEEAEAILTSNARIPYGEIHAGAVYNFLQDDTHVLGIWRRASFESYTEGNPKWETVLDYDALAKKEKKNWIAGSRACLAPDYVHCMIEISDGGKDAGIWREYNTSTKKFVPNGFEIPETKGDVSWIDKDTLLVAAKWGNGSQTTSGYPNQTRVWRRGAAFDEAPIFYKGEEADVGVWPAVYQSDGTPHVFATRSVTFFEREFYYSAEKLVKLPLPKNADLSGVLDNRAMFFMRDAWTYDGQTFPIGSVVAYHLESGKAELVIAASENQSIEDVEIGKSNIVIQYLEDVSGKVARVTRDEVSGAWTVQEIAMPENGVISVVSAGGGTDDALLSFESLTTPDSLYLVRAASNGQSDKIERIFETPKFYDASDVVVEQRFATSADGAKVPYYIMGKSSVLEAGDAPTVQYGYGGFLAATLPVYYSDPGRPQHGALAGKLWISRGGVLVLSNIRGGSEYGPKWHQAALKENRQRSFDDFIAISEDLIANGVTSPEKLGAIGRSNGGLLMGAMLTQRPDLYGALDIGVPLLDMNRYNKLLAGASWMGEYGNPDTDDWTFMREWSPYQLLAADKPYPKVLFYTSTKDDRVHPGHARKAEAKLRDLGYDFFYYENMEGGHGGTANQNQLAYRTALEYTYFAHMLMNE